MRLKLPLPPLNKQKAQKEQEKVPILLRQTSQEEDALELEQLWRAALESSSQSLLSVVFLSMVLEGGTACSL